MLAKEIDSPSGKQVSVAKSKVRLVAHVGAWKKVSLRETPVFSLCLKAGASTGEFR